LEIECKEKEVLLKLAFTFRNSLNDFSTSMDRSFKYLDKIVLPLIMASKKDKSYNPFAEIIEKYVAHILVNKLEKDYKLLPLGFSSDITLEGSDHILNIDIKTANLDNPADFKQTVNVGINQTTHAARLYLRNKLLAPSPFYIYPNLPPYYELVESPLENTKLKLIFTYTFLFIYPHYNDLMDQIRRSYNILFDMFQQNVKNVLINYLTTYSFMTKEEAEKILLKKPENSRFTREELIVENVIRGVFIHREKELLNKLSLSPSDKQIIETFSHELTNFVDNLRKRNVKPIAVVAISLPNGLLRNIYIDKFVSGKEFGKSMRYHYGKGIFEVIKANLNEEIPRVLFLDVDTNYLDELKRYFKNIYLLDYKIKKL
jgi:hypothetical protein